MPEVPGHASLQVRIQHHPARVELIPPLLHHLRAFPCEVVEHFSSPPDPWAGYKQCLSNLPDCTHVLVVQDDALPVPGLSDVLPTIALENPDRPVCLWLSSSPANAAGRARRAYGRSRYISLGPAPYVPLVAVLWPRHRAVEFLEWTETAARITRADDGNVARWARQTKQDFGVTVPSLVEHDDWTPSVKGGLPETQGKDKMRVAMLLAADAREWCSSGR